LGKGGGGWVEAFDDALVSHSPLFNLQIPLSDYNAANGETWLAMLPVPSGPETGNLVASPNPTAGAASVGLTATADNTVRSGSRIAQAEWWLDPRDGPGMLLSPADGAFDSPSEGLRATIDVSPWPAGKYTIVARAKDAQDNWGPVASLVLTVGPPTDTVKITAATYRRGTLTVSATSTAPTGTVTLTAQGVGPLKYDARRKNYSGTFRGIAKKPANVTVTSTGGGSAVATVR
jgi:hypothetical protein